MEKFIVEISARHVHVTDEQVEILFGKGHTLTNKKDLSQPGQFACEEKVTIVGPKGEIEIENGVIVAKRHIHMTPDDAEKYGLVDKQIVEVKVTSDDRTLTFGDVVVRVNPNFALAMHIDTDESNAALCKPGTMGVIL